MYGPIAVSVTWLAYDRPYFTEIDTDTNCVVDNGFEPSCWKVSSVSHCDVIQERHFPRWPSTQLSSTSDENTNVMMTRGTTRSSTKLFFAQVRVVNSFLWFVSGLPPRYSQWSRWQKLPSFSVTPCWTTATYQDRVLAHQLPDICYRRHDHCWGSRPFHAQFVTFWYKN